MIPKTGQERRQHSSKSMPETPRSQPHSSRGRVTTAKRYGVFIVEDHAITRAGLTGLIDLEEDLYVCGGADNATDALLRIAKLEPAVVVTDITLRSSNGLELMKNLMKLCPNVPILAVSGHEEMIYGEPAIRAGARGFLSKATSDQIVHALRTLLRGEIYLSAKLREKLGSTFGANGKTG
jgi:DNA-binding NarL/FixJ family response regulator